MGNSESTEDNDILLSSYQEVDQKDEEKYDPTRLPHGNTHKQRNIKRTTKSFRTDASSRKTTEKEWRSCAKWFPCIYRPRCKKFCTICLWFIVLSLLAISLFLGYVANDETDTIWTQMFKLNDRVIAQKSAISNLSNLTSTLAIEVNVLREQLIKLNDTVYNS